MSTIGAVWLVTVQLRGVSRLTPAVVDGQRAKAVGRGGRGSGPARRCGRCRTRRRHPDRTQPASTRPSASEAPRRFWRRDRRSGRPRHADSRGEPPSRGAAARADGRRSRRRAGDRPTDGCRSGWCRCRRGRASPAASAGRSRPASRCVANVWRSVCGLIRRSSPALRGMALDDLVEPLAREALAAQVDEHPRLVAMPTSRGRPWSR